MSDNGYKNLMRAAAKFILGERSDVRIKGSGERVSTFKEALRASRALYDALSRRDSLEVVAPLIERKHAAARKFHDVTGLRWIL